MIYRFLYSVRVAVVVAGAFLFAQTVTAETNSIIITEIGAYEASGQEWVEIYNNGSASVDLSGWKFWENDTNHGLSLAQGDDVILDPGEYAIIAQKDDVFATAYPTVTATTFDSSWGSLKESGEQIGLKDGDGVVIEQFTYVAAPTFSLERIDYDLEDYTAANWREHADSNTVGVQNSAVPSDTTTSPIAVSVRINEFVSNPSDDEQEWIELFNNSTSSADLTGWVVEDGIGTIATLDQTVAANAYLVIELSSSKLNNAGDIIILKNAVGDIVDQVAYGNWDDGDVPDNEAAPAKGESVAFVSSAFTVTTPTRGAQNTTPESPATPSEDTASPTAPLTARSIEASTIVINEFVSDPADEAEEFIELYNRSTKTIDLSGWWIEDGGESKTMLSGSIEAKGFVVVEKPKGNLNNAGDQVSLFESHGLLIDQVAYGNWEDGKAYDNAPAAKDPNSVARKQDGYDANIDANDFAQTSIVTKGEPNAFPETKRSNITNNANSDIDISITEIFPNPVGSDSDDEFIELRNNASRAVDLSGWTLGDRSSKRFTIQDVVLEPSAYIAFRRSDTRIALNNTGGDDVVLFSEDGNEIDRVSYKGRAVEAYGYAKDEDGGWVWSMVSTPGEKNIIDTPNELPVIVIESSATADIGELISFDATDATDPDGEIVSYAWDFGDTATSSGAYVEHRYTTSDNFLVTLVVEDDRGAVAEQTVEINVKPLYETDDQYDVGVRISEFFPNPEGSDIGEFIELHNATTAPVDISGFQLDDEDGGSRPFIIPEQTVLSAGEYRAFYKKKTGIALNNTQDAARLLYPNDVVIHEREYVDVIEGASYMFHDEQWRWTSTVTPGEENIVTVVQPKSSKKKKRSSSSKRRKPVVPTSLNNIRNFDPGDRVSVTGTVAVLPGVFGSQYFYIVGNGGVQVYQNKKDFPSLKVGDSIQVSGSLSEAYGEYRLKAAAKEDIAVLSSGQILLPQTIDVADVGEIYEGNLIQIAGEITELKSSHMYVDDGTEEVKVYFKKGTGISKKAYVAGQTVEIVGVVNERNGAYQVLPRSADDIVIQGMSEENLVLASAGDNTNKDVAEKYLTATAGGLTSIIIGLFAKARGALAFGFVKRAGTIASGAARRWFG